MARQAPGQSWPFSLSVVVLMAAVAAFGILGAVRPSSPTGQAVETEAPTPREDSLPRLPDLARDIRVRALLESYGPLIDSVEYLENDAVFRVAGGPIYFQDGRMLAEGHLGQGERFHPLFYAYSLEPLAEPPPLTDTPVYSTDFLEYLFGRTELQIRRHGVSAVFLNRRVFVNAFCLDALMAVDREVRETAERDPVVGAWVDDLEVAYSFIDKEIVGSGSRSHHAWGLAIDLVPSSHRGKQVYWRWSRVFNRRSWHRIPISERWNPPQAVIEAFERHGFGWGGKWSHFDTIHFEYRPEILAYNRMRAQESG